MFHFNEVIEMTKQSIYKAIMEAYTKGETHYQGHTLGHQRGGTYTQQATYRHMFATNLSERILNTQNQ